MDMKRILQALDTASTKPVEGANDMKKFLRVIGEAGMPTPAVKIPEVPALPAQDGDQGDGSMLKTNPDGTKSYSGSWGTFIYDASGKAIKYTTPNLNGYGQTIDLATQGTTSTYNQGPMSVQQTTDASGKVTGSDTSYDLGVNTLRQQVDAAGNKTNTSTPVQENDLSKFLSIIDKNNTGVLLEGANPHKVTLPVQMAMQHYQKPTEKAKPRDRIIDKYFTEAEAAIKQRKEEKRELINQYASVIAERVLMKEGKNPCWDGWKRKPGTKKYAPGSCEKAEESIVDNRSVNEVEGSPEGVDHLTKELLQHIVQQVGTEGAHAIVKSLTWGDGAAKELLHLIVRDLEQDANSMSENNTQDIDEGADLSGFNTAYLEKVASGAPGRWMCSPEDAKAELAKRVGSEDPHTEPPQGAKVTNTPAPAQPAGFSKEYLQRASDPNRFGRYMISVEKAQELLKQMQE